MGKVVVVVVDVVVVSGTVVVVVDVDVDELVVVGASVVVVVVSTVVVGATVAVVVGVALSSLHEAAAMRANTTRSSAILRIFHLTYIGSFQGTRQAACLGRTQFTVLLSELKLF